jgi:flagellar biosynthesis GTPase FlhF
MLPPIDDKPTAPPPSSMAPTVPPAGLTDSDVERIMAPLRSELRALKAQLRSSPREEDSVAKELSSMREALSRLSMTPSQAPEASLHEIARSTKIASPTLGRVVALVGPTGAGKTTTIAKLAARMALGRRQKVALISVDTYRVGGEEQIRIYADIIGVPLIVVHNLESLAETVAGLEGYSHIFIDTAGRSPKDVDAIDELVRALKAVQNLEVHLTLPAGSSSRWIDGWVRRFSGLKLDRLLFTKVDEADELEELVRAPARHQTPVSFVTTGQRVPEDIEDASEHRLLSMAGARVVRGEAA